MSAAESEPTGAGTEEFPSRDRLAYDPTDVNLTRKPIDWELADPKTLESMSGAEKELAERHRRVYYAIRDLARALDKVVPPEDGDTLYERMNKIFNPDQYDITPEEPEVGPPDER